MNFNQVHFAKQSIIFADGILRLTPGGFKMFQSVRIHSILGAQVAPLRDLLLILRSPDTNKLFDVGGRDVTGYNASLSA